MLRNVKSGGVNNKPLYDRVSGDFENKSCFSESVGLNDAFDYYKSANYAFTLAEVLITIGVIGIVAAIAIPSLINHYNDKVLETRYKKTKSILINGYKLMMAKDQLFDISQLEFMSDFENKAAEAHKEVFKILSDTNSGLDAETLPKDYAIEDNDSPSQFNWEDVPYIFQTADGTLFGVEQDTENSNIFYVFADLNANAGPNEVKKDLYKFRLSSNAAIADISDELAEIATCSVDNLGACKTSEECYALGSYKNESGACPYMNWTDAAGCRIYNSTGADWGPQYCN